MQTISKPETRQRSGTSQTGAWVLEYELATARRPEPLMGWTSSGDTLNQVRMSFPTKEEALAFVAKKGWDADVAELHERRVIPKNYADNFRTDRPRIGRF